MTSEYSVLIIGYIFGFYMAWNIGANDVANSMASAVGAKAITIRQALIHCRHIKRCWCCFYRFPRHGYHPQRALYRPMS